MPERNIRDFAVNLEQGGSDVHCNVHSRTHRADDDGGKDDCTQIDRRRFIKQRNVHGLVVEISGQLHHMIHKEGKNSSNHNTAGTSQCSRQALSARTADQCQCHGDGKQAGDDRNKVGVVSGKNGGNKHNKDGKAGKDQRKDGLKTLGTSEHQQTQQKDGSKNQDRVGTVEVASFPFNVFFRICLEQKNLVSHTDRTHSISSQVVDFLQSFHALSFSVPGKNVCLKGDDVFIINMSADFSHIISVMQNLGDSGNRRGDLHLIAEKPCFVHR